MEYKEQLNNIIPLLNEAEFVCLEVSKTFAGKDIANTTLLLNFLLEKSMGAAAACHELLPDYLKCKVHEYAMGIILRPSFLDLLFVLNINQLLGQGKIEEMDDFSFDILLDGLKNLLNNIEEEHQNDLSETYEKLVRALPFAFEAYSNDGSKPILIRMKNNSNSYKAKPLYLALEGDDITKKYFKGIYDLYTTYSKYEHVQILYLHISRAPDEMIKGRLCEAFRLLFLQINLIISTLKQLNPENTDLDKWLEKADQLSGRVVSFSSKV